MNSPCGRANTVYSSMATMESLVYLYNSFVNGLLYTERYLDQYPPAKTPCIDATYFQRSPNKQLKNQCLNSHAHTLRRTFCLPKKPMFPKFIGATGAYPSVPTKTLAAKKTSSVSKIQSITLQWSGFNQSPGIKKHGILFLISLGFEP